MLKKTPKTPHAETFPSTASAAMKKRAVPITTTCQTDQAVVLSMQHPPTSTLPASLTLNHHLSHLSHQMLMAPGDRGNTQQSLRGQQMLHLSLQKAMPTKSPSPPLMLIQKKTSS